MAARRSSVIIALILLAIPIMAPTVAAAQTEDPADEEPADAGEGEQGGFSGTLTAQTEAGERVPVAEATVTVEGADDLVEATSGDDGSWEALGFPPGSYVVSIDEGSLPDGISLRDSDRQSLELELNRGQNRTVLFALIEGEGAASAGDSTLERAARLSVDGLIFGLIIAMCSIGLSLIFGTTGLTNFSHGEMVTFGALVALALNDPNVLGLGIVVAGFIAVLATAGFGWLQEKGLWRPLRNRGTGLIAMLVISIGLSIVLRYTYLYQAGGRQVKYTQFALQTEGVEIGPVTLVPRELWIIGISVVVLLAVALAVQRTRLGKAMRAVADNRDLAESSGIDVESVILAVWVMGGALAGLGGVLFGLKEGVSWDMGFELLLLMFAAVTLGGLGTAYGPLVGSLIVGVFINISTLFIAPELKNIGALLVLVIILMVRPQGLFGVRERVG